MQSKLGDLTPSFLQISLNLESHFTKNIYLITRKDDRDALAFVSPFRLGIPVCRLSISFNTNPRQL